MSQSGQNGCAAGPASVDWLTGLLARHQTPLLRYVSRLTGDLDAARDVVQEALLRLCERLPSEWLCERPPPGWLSPGWPPPGWHGQTVVSSGRECAEARGSPDDRAVAWLYQVCRRRAIDVRRKERRMRLVADLPIAQGAPDRDDLLAGSGTAESAIAASHPRPDECVEQTDAATGVLALVAELPERQQEILRLRFTSGLSYKQIAAVLGLSATNVGFLIHTAIKTIRGKVQQTEESAGRRQARVQ